MFAITFFWISINNIIHYYRIIYEFKKIELVIGIITYICIAFLICKFLVPKIKKYKLVRGLILILILGITIYSALQFRVEIKWNNSNEYTWDMGNVFSNAERISKGDSSDYNYLRAFPNNIMITLIFAVVMKLGTLCGVSDLILLMTMFNAIIIWLAVLFMYINAKMIYGDQGSMILLIITLFCTPIYMYAPIFYTDTMSMLFVMLMLFFILKVSRNQGKASCIVHNIALGIIAFIGMKVKLTTIFIMIAFVIYAILQCNIKSIIRRFCIAVLVFCGCMLLYNNLVNRYIIKDANQSRVPVEHWILMGLKGDGNFNGEDYIYTMGYKTYDQKKDADIKLIKERFSQYNKSTFIQHLNKKMVFTWGDGTYYAPTKLGRQPHRPNRLHEYVLRDGSKTKYFKNIPQAMQGGMIVFLIVSSMGIVINKSYKKNTNVVLLITIYGFMLFLLIWENRSRYILTALPVMLIAQVDGIMFFTDFWTNRCKNIEKEDEYVENNDYNIL